MSNSMVLKRSDKTSNWIKGRDTGGYCASISWNEFESILRHVRRLGQNEQLERVKIERDGITFYIDDIIKRC